MRSAAEPRSVATRATREKRFDPLVRVFCFGRTQLACNAGETTSQSVWKNGRRRWAFHFPASQSRERAAWSILPPPAPVVQERLCKKTSKDALCRAHFCTSSSSVRQDVHRRHVHREARPQGEREQWRPPTRVAFFRSSRARIKMNAFDAKKKLTPTHSRLPPSFAGHQAVRGAAAFSLHRRAHRARVHHHPE